MCGISGFLILDQITQAEAQILAENLLLYLQDRGKDATGIYTDSKIVKAPLKADQFIKKVHLPTSFGKITLLHNRAGTQGKSENNNNNHPVFGYNWVLIHNGVLSMERLATYPYMGEVDSEILLSYIEIHGLKEALTKVEGSAAIALTKIGGDSIYLWRNSSPIKLGYVPDKCYIFASTADAIYDACDQVFGRHKKFPKVLTMDTAEERLLQITKTGLRDLGKFQCKSRWRTAYYPIYFGKGGNYYYDEGYSEWYANKHLKDVKGDNKKSNVSEEWIKTSNQGRQGKQGRQTQTQTQTQLLMDVKGFWRWHEDEQRYYWWERDEAGMERITKVSASDLNEIIRGRRVRTDYDD